MSKLRKPLTWLREDWDLYPRRNIDSSNVRDLVEALKAGADLPPVIAEAATGRIIDGFHRSRAYTRVFGVDHVIDVIVNEYPSDVEAFADAVRLNASHGRKLNSSDRIMAYRRMQEWGVSDEDIELIVRIPAVKVERLSARVAFRESGDVEPLKGGDVHLKGRTVTDGQAEVLSHRLGVSYGRLARQIIDGCRAGLLPDDEAFWLLLEELHRAVGEVLATRARSA